MPASSGSRCHHPRLDAVRATVVLMLSASLPSLAVAQSDEPGPSIQVGESDLYPALRVEYLANDNAFLTPDNEEDSSDVRIAPELLWRADRRSLIVEGRYLGEYQSSDIDAREYADHIFSLGSSATFGARHRASGSLSVELGHEDVGTELLLGSGEDIDEPVTFTEVVGNAAYTFGADEARGNVQAGLNIESFAYDSFENAAGDDITDGRDFTLLEPYGIFSLRLSPETRALLGGSVGSYEFDSDNRDRTDYSLFTGLSFDPTGAIGGEVRLGATTAEFAEGDRDDQTSFTAAAEITWQPVSFSRVRLVYDREFDNRTSNVPDPNDPTVDLTEDVLLIEDRLRVDWRYDWSSRVRHRAYVQRTGKERICPELDTATISGGIELSLQVRRWVEVGAGVQTASRGADNCTDGGDANDVEYDRQLLSAYARFTL